MAYIIFAVVVALLHLWSGVKALRVEWVTVGRRNRPFRTEQKMRYTGKSKTMLAITDFCLVGTYLVLLVLYFQGVIVLTQLILFAVLAEFLIGLIG
ncbi:MAG: hypothetical protein AAF653_18845, partial [Chloroflexota bacterium]